MKTFSDFRLISETFKNLVGPASIEDRRLWADRVWNILQSTYAKIGGIKGSGFESKETMIEHLPFWKLFIRGDAVKAVIIYKDKGGRKSVAIGTDGSPEAKAMLSSILKSDLGVSWGEQSKGVLVFTIKSAGINTIRPFLLTPQEVSSITGMPVFPVTPERLAQLDDTDKVIYKRYTKDLGDYFYVRDIGGNLHLKVSLGTPNIKIK